MKAKARAVLVLLLGVTCVLGGYWWFVVRPAERQPVAQRADEDALPGIELEDGVSVGKPGHFDNLAVFPIYAVAQVQLTEFQTLAKALETGSAEVRELGTAAADDAELQNDSARVNTLVIENKGDKPLFVLAGTVVKGGKQDRQIAQDFVIEPKKTVPVEAYCVEQGRWNGARDGRTTGGKFNALPSLANAEVQAAGQFEGDQGKVWAEVAGVNLKNAKQTDTGTLAATLDDATVAAERDATAATITAFLASRKQPNKLVGLAYAVDGKVRTARWFMSNQLFLQQRDVLVKTAALEAITARSARKAAGDKPVGVAKDLQPDAVRSLVASIRKAQDVQHKLLEGGNSADQLKGALGYGSRARWRPAVAEATMSGKKAPAPRPISTTFIAK